METDFVLGDDVEIDGRNQSSKPWIWPVCHPKNDDDPEFESNRGMIAGWLDAPPLDQTFTKLLGSGVSEAEVYRSVGMTKIYFTLSIFLLDHTTIRECQDWNAKQSVKTQNIRGTQLTTAFMTISYLVMTTFLIISMAPVQIPMKMKLLQ